MLTIILEHHEKLHPIIYLNTDLRPCFLTIVKALFPIKSLNKPLFRSAYKRLIFHPTTKPTNKKLY